MLVEPVHHLTIVLAALAVSHWIEDQTGWSIRKFVRSYRTIQIQVGPHTVTAVDPVPDDLQEALTKISSAHQDAHQPDKSRVLSGPMI